MLLKWSIKTIIGVVVVALGLFLSAGRWDWVPAWVVVGFSLLNQILVYVFISRVHIDLLEERSRIQPGTKKWDRWLAPLMAYSGLYICIACGLDVRFGWTAAFPAAVQWLGGVLVAAGLGLGLWAMVANRFFAATVRIQKERGQYVVQSGPYRFIRHPGYAAAILFDIGIPLLLASYWGLVIGAVTIGIAALRTVLEDQTLRAELPGYTDYASRVRYRWIPMIW